MRNSLQIDLPVYAPWVSQCGFCLQITLWIRALQFFVFFGPFKIFFLYTCPAHNEKLCSHVSRWDKRDVFLMNFNLNKLDFWCSADQISPCLLTPFICLTSTVRHGKWRVQSCWQTLSSLITRREYLHFHPDSFNQKQIKCRLLLNAWVQIEFFYCFHFIG